MPRVHWLGFVVALLGFVGCGVVEFDIEEDIPPTTIIGDPTAPADRVDAVSAEQPLNIDIQAETEKHRTGPASSARLKSLTFTITTPAGGTFYFARYVSIYIHSPNDPSLPLVEIARLPDVPDAATISVPPIPGVELLPYAKAGAMITATATGNWPHEDTVYGGKVVITVKI